MKSFSIQKPRIRNYINEWIFHELSGELNLVKLKYDFIDLKIKFVKISFPKNPLWFSLIEFSN